MRNLLKNLNAKLASSVKSRTARHIVLVVALLVAGFVASLDREVPPDAALQDIRDAINTKPASGEIILVEIDAKSLNAIDNWPWPREHHAKLVDRLVEAGATQILFDVDFSSRSTKDDDALFADAILRAGGKVVLPTFRQPASSGDQRSEIENLPIDILRDNAFLGSVNVRASIDGRVNTYPLGTMTDGIPRPSFGALLADANGPVNANFELDQSIEISTIPRFSFTDVVDGRFDPNAFRGKKVIVGATAIEMGDRYATARFGIVPGVIIQILAGETLLAGMALPQLGPWPLLVFAALVIIILSRFLPGKRLIDGKCAALVAFIALCAPLLAERFAFASFEVAPALLLVIICLAAQYVLDVLSRVDQEGLSDRDTGLPNLAAWQRQEGDETLSVVVVAEIANLGQILSTLGDADSKILIESIANRLTLSSGAGNLYKIGQHLFCWRIDDANGNSPEALIESASQLFNAPFLIAGRSVRAAVCFGLARGPFSDPSSLSNKAVLAAERANDMGIRLSWYDHSLAQDTDLALFVTSEFEDALRSGHVFVVYQPKYSIAARRVVSAEALIRWENPDRGFINPAVFVPILERENLMEALTLFVLTEVCTTMNEWNAAGREMGCAINISAALLSNTLFVEHALSVLQESGVNTSMVTFELTETAVLASPESAAEAVAKFSSLGIRLSIDDYGTGQSTLSYLKNFSASEIKIDQSFVTSIATSNSNLILVRSTIEMAHALDLKVVAEGAEDQASMSILEALGCDFIQGWHIGKPLPKEHFTSVWCKAEPPLRLASAG